MTPVSIGGHDMTFGKRLVTLRRRLLASGLISAAVATAVVGGTASPASAHISDLHWTCPANKTVTITWIADSYKNHEVHLIWGASRDASYASYNLVIYHVYKGSLNTGLRSAWVTFGTVGGAAPGWNSNVILYGHKCTPGI